MVGENRTNTGKIRQEEESRKEAKRVDEERRIALLAERKKRQEEILRKEQESRNRKIRQKTLDKRWEMMRWVTKYIDENHKKLENRKEKESSKHPAEAARMG